jgi:hypothetical protein
MRFLVRQPVGSEHEVDVVPGLRHDMVQSFDMIVSDAAGADLHTVVIANAPVLSEHDKNVVAQALSSTRRPMLTFLVDSSPGNVLAESSSGADPEAAASAVAVVRASAGWDEDSPLEVRLDEQPRRVTPGFDGKNWRCRVG